METIQIKSNTKLVNNKKRFEYLPILYPFNEISFKEKKYEDGNFWYPYLLDIVDNRINRNIIDIKPEIGISLNIFLSNQFDRYFDKDEIKTFLQEKINLYEDVFLIGLVYRENRNGRIIYDMLPCFTETSKKDENIMTTAQRLIGEECFSSWSSNQFANWYNNIFRKEITVFEKCIDDVFIDYSVFSDDEKDEDNRRKVALYLWGYNIDKGIQFMNDWRCNQHNLGTTSERKHMVDVCIVFMKDILDILEK